MTILTKEMQEKFDRITLDCAFSNEREYAGNIKKNHISYLDGSDSSKIYILDKLREREFIIDDATLISYLQNNDVVGALTYLTTFGDLFITKEETGGYQLADIYCPKVLSPYQILRLRMWYEYFNRYVSGYEIHSPNYQKPIDCEEELFQEFINENHINDDEYIRKLTPKYPNFE